MRKTNFIGIEKLVLKSFEAESGDRFFLFVSKDFFHTPQAYFTDRLRSISLAIGEFHTAKPYFIASLAKARIALVASSAGSAVVGAA